MQASVPGAGAAAAAARPAAAAFACTAVGRGGPPGPVGELAKRIPMEASTAMDAIPPPGSDRNAAESTVLPIPRPWLLLCRHLLLGSHRRPRRAATHTRLLPGGLSESRGASRACTSSRNVLLSQVQCRNMDNVVGCTVVKRAIMSATLTCHESRCFGWHKKLNISYASF